MDNSQSGIGREAIRNGLLPWSADELEYVLSEANGAESALHLAAARFQALGLDSVTTLAHGMRLFAVLDFLHDHHDRLYEIGLLLPRDHQLDLVSRHLLELLATSPFRSTNGRPKAGGGGDVGFDADDIIIEAGRRQKLSDQQPG